MFIDVIMRDKSFDPHYFTPDKSREGKVMSWSYSSNMFIKSQGQLEFDF